MSEDGEVRYKLIPKGESDPLKPGAGENFGGEATAYYKNKDVYSGIYVGGRRSGRGTYSFHNEDVYNGQFQNNDKDGFGQMTYSAKSGKEDEDPDAQEGKPPRGGTYLGSFTKGMRGCGTGKDPDEKDAGSGMSKSAGTFTYVNKDVYVGQWQAGKKQGKGTYRYAKDGTQLDGIWENGQIQQGKWIFPNGTFYCGSFKHNKPNGKGIWVFKNGNQLTGDFVQKVEQAEEGDPDAPPEKPKVACQWKPGKFTALRGGDVFGPRSGAIALVKPPLDWPWPLVPPVDEKPQAEEPQA